MQFILFQDGVSRHSGVHLSGCSHQLCWCDRKAVILCWLNKLDQIIKLQEANKSPRKRMGLHYWGAQAGRKKKEEC